MKGFGDAFKKFDDFDRDFFSDDKALGNRSLFANFENKMENSFNDNNYGGYGKFLAEKAKALNP
jgi:hypothetical protein